MTIGYIGDCVVGSVDANGNTIASCGDPLPGGGISLPPTCMPGDTLTDATGSWICAPGAPSSFSLGSMGVLIPVGLLIVFAVMGARK